MAPVEGTRFEPRQSEASNTNYCDDSRKLGSERRNPYLLQERSAATAADVIATLLASELGAPGAL